MTKIICKDEVYKIIGVCIEVHRQLGKSFLKIVYKDAIEYDYEKEYLIHYKDIILSFRFFADFIVFNKVILEVKSCNGIVDEFFARTINYLAASKL